MRAKRFTRIALLTTLFEVAGLISYGAANARVVWSDDDHKALCRKLDQAVNKLPASIHYEELPGSIQMEGLTRPQWTVEDPLANLDLLRIAATYFEGGLPYAKGDILPGDPGAPDLDVAWAKVKDEWLAEVKSGTLQLQSASITLLDSKFQYKPHEAKVYRIGIPKRSLGTLQDPPSKYSGPEFWQHLQQEPMETNWDYIIGSAAGESDVHNYPLSLGQPADVVSINGEEYFLTSFPGAGLIQPFMLHGGDHAIVAPAGGCDVDPQNVLSR
jgi:hypothetical protein